MLLAFRKQSELVKKELKPGLECTERSEDQKDLHKRLNKEDL